MNPCRLLSMTLAGLAVSCAAPMDRQHPDVPVLAAGVTPAGKTSDGYHARVSELRIDAGAFGDEWRNAVGLVVDDLRDLSGLSARERDIAAPMAAKLVPLGIVAMADFSYRVPGDQGRYLIVRVFQFTDSPACDAWWERKYRHEGWERFYRTVGGLGYPAVDSLQMSQRAVAIDNVWITCQQVNDNEDHLEFLTAYVDRVRGGR